MDSLLRRRALATALVIALLSTLHASAPAASLVPAASPFTTLRVATTPAPLQAGAAGTIVIDTNGGLDNTLTWRVVGSDGITEAIPITVAVVDSSTRATITVNVPPSLPSGRYSLLGLSGSNTMGFASFLVGSGEGTYNAIPPSRVLDTRLGVGFGRALEDGETISVTALGIGTVPSANVSAIVATLTAVTPTGDGYLAAFPSGQALPNVSNLNFRAGEVVPNQVVVAPGTGGTIDLHNAGGRTHVLLDVVGWFSDASGPLGWTYGANTGNSAWRVLDTRATAPIAARATTRFTVPSVSPLGRRTSIVANVTVDRPAATGFLTVYQAGLPTRPNSSINNFTAGRANAATATIATDVDGRIDIYNGSDGPIHVIIDVLGGYYTESPAPNVFRPVATPYRAIDMRLAPFARRLTPKELFTSAIGASRTPANASFVVGNITATGATGLGWMNVTNGGCCGDLSVRNSSIVNFAADQTVANAFVSSIGPDGSLLIYNDASPVYAIVDVFGGIGQ
jgi:hypothetical protein